MKGGIHTTTLSSPIVWKMALKGSHVRAAAEPKMQQEYCTGQHCILCHVSVVLRFYCLQVQQSSYWEYIFQHALRVVELLVLF